MDKTFTFDEANVLLPILESLLKRAMEAKSHIEAIDQEMQNLGHRIFLHGGVLVDVPAVVKRKQEREEHIQQIKDSVTEIHATGVQVKDLDIGLLDFPCVVEGETVLLCWKLGERAITHYHSTDEGFAGRKPIDHLIPRAGGGKKQN